jgi:hypothetical protein
MNRLRSGPNSVTVLVSEQSAVTQDIVELFLDDSEDVQWVNPMWLTSPENQPISETVAYSVAASNRPTTSASPSVSDLLPVVNDGASHKPKPAGVGNLRLHTDGGAGRATPPLLLSRGGVEVLPR